MINTIILGIIQGFTEFLPVSSSGHLALFERIFGITSENLFLETAMHLGTLFSLFVYFRKKIKNLVISAFSEIRENRRDKENTRFIVYVIAGIIPAAAAGIFLYDLIRGAFSNMILVGMLFFVTGLVLLAMKWMKPGKGINMRNALFIGTMQVFALLPGISRSGITISSGVLSGLKREQAADFSFFMAMPLILGSFIKEFLHTGMYVSAEVAAGIIASFISGYIAIVLLYRILKTQRFYLFALYLIPLGIAVFIFGMAGKI